MNFKVSASLLCWACTEFGGYKLEATLFHAQSITTSNWVMFLNPQSSDANFLATEGIMQILGLEKNRGTCRGSCTNMKIPHLRVHKPKIAVVGSAVVKAV